MRSRRVHHFSGPTWHQGKKPRRAAAMMRSGVMSRQTPAKVSGRGRVVASLGTFVPPREMSAAMSHNRNGRSAMRLGWQA